MSSPIDILQVGHLRRTLGPKGHVAVDDLSFSIKEGEIVCLLGPNGAGKTTTVKLCSTLLAPNSGTVVINGTDAVKHPRQARRSMGLVLGGDRGFYLRASALDNILFFADVAGVPRRLRQRNTIQALESTSLIDRMHDPVQALSKGMRQRLHIARGLVSKPRLLLLDEPTSGLDPEIALEIRELVRSLAQDGVAILLTTHHLREAEVLADNIKLLQNGGLVVEGTAADLAATAGVRKVTTFTSPDVTRAQLGRIKKLSRVVSVQADVRDQRTLVTVAWSSQPDERALLGELMNGGGGVPLDLATRGPTLEESYLALVSGNSVGAART